MKLQFAIFTLLAGVQLGFAQELSEIAGKVVDSSTKLPLAGASVVLLRWTSQSFKHDAVDEAVPTEQPQDPASPIFSMLTGEDGRFRFKTTPGNFTLHARCKGYVPFGGDLKTSTALNLKPDQKRSDLVIAMESPAFISGVVIDADAGKPIAGLEVTPMLWQVSDGRRALVFTSAKPATTGKDGSYTLKGLSPGEYVIQVAPARGERFLPAGTVEEFHNSSQLAYVRYYYPGVERREQAQSVALLPGAPLERIDFKIAKRRAAAIRGCVHGDGETDPAAEVILSLTAKDREGLTSMYSMIGVGKKVPLGGCFRIEGLAPGKYWLSAVAGLVTPTKIRQGVALLDLDDQKIEDLELNVTKGFEIKGHVRPDETAGGVALKDLKLKVVLFVNGRPSFGGLKGAEVSTADGGFTLQGVLPDLYRVYVQGLPKTLALGALAYNGATSPRADVSLNSGALDQRLELVLYPATASIAVSVEGGQKAAGAQLVLLSEAHDPEDPQGDARTIPADAEGRGTFANLLAGKYRVWAFPANAAWRTDSSFVRQTVAGTDVDLSQDGKQNVEVKLSSFQ